MRLPELCKKQESLYAYIDYRRYLHDFFEYKKSSVGYSYRDFSSAAGVNSSSWLLLLIKGTKNLSDKSAAIVATVLALGPGEREYFKLLVRFGQARTSQEKDRHYQQVLAFKNKRGIASMEEKHYAYYSKWYYPVIRSLVNKVDFGNDYSLLAASTIPRITARQAQQAVGLLKRLQMIERDAQGRWQQTDPVITTGDEVRSLQIVNYHRQVAVLARDAHDWCLPQEREISAMTLGIGEPEFCKIKQRIQEFRKEIIEIARAAEHADRVYQLNFQLFPVSKTVDSNRE